MFGCSRQSSTIIEKHFTADKTLAGPDHSSSIEGDELKHLVQGVREIEAAIGRVIKQPQPSELKNKNAIRKSLVAKTRIRKGDVFSENNLTVKRPGGGLSPIYFWELMGTKSTRDYSEDELIETKYMNNDNA